MVVARGNGTASSTPRRAVRQTPSSRSDGQCRADARQGGGTNHGARAAAVMARVALLVLLVSSCVDQVPPLLEVSPTAFLELSSARSTIVVTNAGGGALQWRATSDNPLVRLSATEGRILRGASRTLTIDVDDTTLDLDDVVSATLTFASNGGDAELSISYTVGSGIGMCGSYLPPELGSVARASIGDHGVAGTALPALAQLRTARPGPGARAVPGEVLVGYHEWVPGAPVAVLTADDDPAAARSSAVAHAVRSELTTVTGASLLTAGVAGSPDLFMADDAASLVDALLADPRVRYAHLNYYLDLQYVPNDPDFAKQWNLSMFGLPQAWDRYRGEEAAGGTVVIAVIDSGVYGTHPDLVSKLLPGWDFNDNDANTNPGAPNGHAEHGTHVAGIAAALGDDGYGVTGVAMGSAIRILPVKVFDAAGVNASISDLVKAIRWSAGLAVAGAPSNPNRAHVINMSLGVPGFFPALDAATLDAWHAGSLLIGAAGNHTGAMEDPGVLSPANAPCVIAVGSIDSDYEVSSFSNTGPQLELVAPGGFSNSGCARVYSTVPPPAFHDCLSGTSMAAPFVAGVAALLFGDGELTTQAQVRDRLTLTALRGHWMTDARSYGNGVVCADAALGAATVCGSP